MLKKINNFVNHLLDELNTRQKDILVNRFGLENGSRETLQAIGDKFKITRERVRQIENQALGQLKILLKKEKDISLAEPIKQYLVSCGGIRRDDLLMQDLKSLAVVEEWPKFFEEKLRFLFCLCGEPRFFEADENFYDFWYLDEKTKNRAFQKINIFLNFIKKTDPDKVINRKIHLSHLKDLALVNYLSLSKKFGTNVFGDFGLSSWPEIQPKFISDKIYLILKKNDKPLHFGEITSKINELKFDCKKAYPQTVHNELIRDERFVLVGRGIYGLREQGYQPGTAAEVIVRILKEYGPLDSQKIIQLVQKERFFRKNTILLNLQNKCHFKRLPDNRYVLIREA